jgi:hypothetical protein
MAAHELSLRPLDEVRARRNDHLDVATTVTAVVRVMPYRGEATRGGRDLGQ